MSREGKISFLGSMGQQGEEEVRVGREAVHHQFTPAHGLCDLLVRHVAYPQDPPIQQHVSLQSLLLHPLTHHHGKQIHVDTIPCILSCHLPRLVALETILLKGFPEGSKGGGEEHPWADPQHQIISLQGGM